MNAESASINAQKDLAVGLLPFFFAGSLALTAVMLARRSIRQDLRHQSPSRWLTCVTTLVLVGTAIIFGGFYFLGYFSEALTRDTVSSIYIPLLYAVQALAQQLIIKVFFKPMVVGSAPPAAAGSHAKSAAIVMGGSLPILAGLVFRYTDFEDTSMIYIVLPVFIALPFIVIWFISSRHT